MAELDEHISRSSKIAYSLANGANGLLSGIGEGQIMFFYLVRLHMDPALQGIVWLIFSIWNSLNDPLFGILEEKTKSKLGRRIPYLRYGALFYVPLFIILWFPFATVGDQTGLFWNLLIMLFLFDSIYSAIGLITYSLPAEMAITAKERGSIMVYSTIISGFSIALSYILPIAYLANSSVSIEIWQLIMTFVAFFAGLLLYFSSFYIKENRWAQKEETLGFFDSIKETVKNPQFLILEVVIFAMTIAQTILTGGITFLFRFVLQFQGIVSYLYLIPVGAALGLAIYEFNKLISKIGIKKIFLYGTLIGALGFGLLPFFGRDISTLFIPLMLVMVCLAALLMTSTPLMADVIDYDEVLTGKRRETTYSGINALFTKPSISIANWLFLLIIANYGYNDNLDVQPDSVETGIILAYAIIPVICILIANFALYFFKLDGPAWMEKKKELAAIHDQKEKDYVEELRRNKEFSESS